ncbi:heme exporter protein CcmB [Marinibactrum halimedae]|uniref:Heme exporter protein B n=1 Tax=Marinibactrum halimedae TaxID=1444977 RepID=A0AA37T577_9GAMM|nr:heme exporter protein CcmB [Marinibactrum halimedae]MCD9460398.1 heme exporter protein CcmB [Marinibactrum halimedae]GLS27473.1 heme exporter protein B [Marinibactrum halimedae]
MTSDSLSTAPATDTAPLEIPDINLWSGFAATFKRDITVAFRSRGDIANPLIFFLIVITMVPLGISPERDTLALLAPGMIWVVALLATLLSLDGLFRTDYEDGSLEQLLISPHPLYFIVISKVLVHWLMTGLPLTITAPILGVMLSLPNQGYMPLIASLAIGTGVLSLIGAIGSALTVGLRKGGLLLSLIIMPLYVPVLIFGASAVSSASEGFPFVGQLAILGAFLAMAMILAPFAAAGALRISVNG